MAIVGGGTAGHVYPALAVAAAFTELHPGAEITFLGTELGFEGKLVRAAGQRLVIIPGSPIFGSGVSGKLRAFANAVAGMSAARRFFEETATEALLSFGSYASAGPVLGGRRLGLPIAICEPNVMPGLANRLLARFADEVFVGWPAARKAFPGTDAQVTGIPIRAALSRPRPPRPPGSTETLRILVLGGSLGSSFLNRRAPEVIGELARRSCRAEVRHQSGAAGESDVRAAYADRSVDATVTPFLEDIVSAYDWADVAITSAGAITLAELAAAALPAFIVPLAAASEDHQAANARAFAAVTGCPWTTESQWDVAGVADVLQQMAVEPQRRAGLSERMSAVANGDAAVEIARRCGEMIVRRR